MVIMSIRQAVLLYLILPISPALDYQQANITLSLNETALIDPSPYFNDQFSEFNITQSDRPSATVLPQLEVKEVSEAETQGTEWRFAASVVTSEFSFFSVLYTHKVEVWRVDGHSLSKMWETDANVGRIVGVSMDDVEGFVYWTHSSHQLYFIDLRQFPLSANEIKGIDLSSVSHIAVCSARKSITAVEHSLEGYVLKSFSVNYATLSLEEGLIIPLNTRAGEILEILCSNQNYYMSSQAFYRENEYLRIPVSFGSPLCLEQIGNSNDVYMRASGGAILEGFQSLLLPGTARILSLKDKNVQIVQHESELTVVIEELDNISKTPLRRQLPLKLESIDSILWLESYFDGISIVQKYGTRLKLLTVEIATSLIQVSGERLPYAFTLCGADYKPELTSRCIRFFVSVIPEPSPGLLVSDQNYLFSPANFSLSYSAILKHRHSTYIFSLAQSLSGPNIEVKNLSLSNLPAHTSYKLSLIHPPNMEALSYPLPKVDEKAQFLCSTLDREVIKVVLLLNGKVTERVVDDSVTIDVGKALPLSCVYFEEDLIIYAREENGYSKLVNFSPSFHNITKVTVDNDKFLSLAATETHIILTYSSEVLILAGRTEEVQRIPAKTEYLSASVSRDLLVLQTARTLECYVKKEARYEFRGEIEIEVNTVQFALIGSALLTLDRENYLRMYFLTGNYRIIQRFAYQPTCQVLYITDFERYLLYRCKEYIQLIHVNLPRFSHEWKRIPADFHSTLIAHHLISQKLIELHISAGEWVVRKFLIVSEAESSTLVEIDIKSEYIVTGSIALQGVLTVSSQDYLTEMPVNLVLENYGAVIAMTEEAGSIGSSGGSSVIEVPWDEELVIEPRRLFQGELMLFSAKSADPRVAVTVQNPLVADFTLQGLNSAIDVRIAQETKTLFYCSKGLLIARGFNCANQSCAIISEHSISLRLLNIDVAQQLDVLCTIGSFTLLRIIGNICNARTYQSSSILVSFDNKSGDFDFSSILFPHTIEHQYEVVKRTVTTIDIFFYRYTLEHCIGTLNSTLKIACTEVTIPRLVQISSVGSRQISEFCWELYALTKAQELFTLRICDDLSIMNVSSLYAAIHIPVLEPMVFGGKLIIIKSGNFCVFSLPDFRFLYSIPWGVLGMFTQSRRYRRAMGEVIISYNVISRGYCLASLEESSKSLLLIAIPFEKFQFTGPNQVAGWVNKTLAFINFSRGKVVLERDGSQLETVETEIEITATNELSERKVKLRVVRSAKGRWRWVAAGMVGVTCTCILLIRRKGRKPRQEIELQVVY